ncbi:antitoxin Xre/MbcA/ParS toxin-binding domain-containing protein [Teredinibacter turnerae]|uniref:Transcriptional regulator, XRE family n=1 Tax=Teredinibacter turnerae (strain ATCC 39867 / T7901) TaxID=377629 RepID=C5BMV6_TERTT|nr:antitoxin Xre/MbcA/ParS toxin-binding domain-containing protein [Teredinibacter turnerae]ACR14012.1 transcriptional regulator, XRE family [Teredinibacter turnerae T7901]
MKPSIVQSDSAIVANALLDACPSLGITQDQLAQVLGVSRATVARIKKKASTHQADEAIAPSSKPFELALLVIRVYRSLYAIVGGNVDAMKHWMNTPNHHLNLQKPIDLIQTALGLSEVIWYLDAMRGKI